LKSTADFEFRVYSARQIPEKLADRSEYSGLLNADCRIPEARRELQRVDSIIVHDAVQIDVTDIALFRQLHLHLQQRLIEQVIRPAPEHRRAHFARRRSDVARKKLLMLEVDVDGVNKTLPVEERTGRYLHADHAPL